MDRFSPPAVHLDEARKNAKQIVVAGVVWLVYELPPLWFDRRSTPYLIFESEAIIRRVRSYPADWRSLSDEALIALSWSM